MKKLIGTIIDSFTIHDMDRVLIIKDASVELKVVEGDSIEVELISGNMVHARVLDAFCEEGSHFNGTDSQYVVSIRIPNIDFPTDNKVILGGKVFLIINKAS